MFRLSFNFTIIQLNCDLTIHLISSETKYFKLVIYMLESLCVMKKYALIIIGDEAAIYAYNLQMHNNHSSFLVSHFNSQYHCDLIVHNNK